MEHLHVLAGLAYDPNIRGILIVLVSTVILFGSIYLIVATNTGSRLGLLIAGAGLAGWMVIMGLTWMLYGIGLRGQAPVWHVVEVNVAQTHQAETEAVRSLPNPEELPSSAELIESNPEIWDPEEFDATDSLSDLAAAPGGCELFRDMDLGGWTLASVSDLGEPQATIDAALVAEGIFERPTDYLVLSGFDKGGKAPLATCPDDEVTRIDRITRYLTSLSPTHPVHHFVLQVQPVILQTPVPGEAPPVPQVDPTEPVISVVMVRDLGNLRFPAAMVTLANLLVFMVLVSMLNRRDRVAQQHIDEAG